MSPLKAVVDVTPKDGLAATADAFAAIDAVVSPLKAVVAEVPKDKSFKAAIADALLAADDAFAAIDAVLSPLSAVVDVTPKEGLAATADALAAIDAVVSPLKAVVAVVPIWVTSADVINPVDELSSWANELPDTTTFFHCAIIINFLCFYFVFCLLIVVSTINLFYKIQLGYLYTFVSIIHM